MEGDLLPPKTEALLRLTLPTDATVRKEVVLERVPGNAFEGHGAELSIRGDWNIQVIVRLVGSFNYSGQTALTVLRRGIRASPARIALALWDGGGRWTSAARRGIGLLASRGTRVAPRSGEKARGWVLWQLRWGLCSSCNRAWVKRQRPSISWRAIQSRRTTSLSRQDERSTKRTAWSVTDRPAVAMVPAPRASIHRIHPRPIS
ncbi:MAG: hypothetical protein KatS3mg059_0642 [Thermomicrobiales bacterium]|nr:MAG: hypothetical protein KatS3mg059_0642 [Thermomicrobiales bacterium]